MVFEREIKAAEIKNPDLEVTQIVEAGQKVA
jgi:hypothetical protein